MNDRGAVTKGNRTDDNEASHDVNSHARTN